MPKGSTFSHLSHLTPPPLFGQPHLTKTFFDNHPKDMTTFIFYSTSIKKNCWSHIFSSWIHLSCSPSFSWLSQRLWYCLCPAGMEFMVTMVTETKPIFVKWHLTFSLHLREGPQKKTLFLVGLHYPLPNPCRQLEQPFHRGGICPSRQCRRLCKIFASGVNILLKLLKLGKIDGVKFLTWKFSGVNFGTNSMSAVSL